MTILLTGATGLVGARLLPRLVAAGHNVRVILRQGREAPEGASTVRGDLLDPSTLPAAVDGVSAIVHLAAVFRSHDEDLIWKSNLEGTRNLIAAAEAHAPDARLIMASTTNVYGPETARPAQEDDPVAPVLAYPASKVAAEEALCASRVIWSILRFGFVYGEGDGHLEMLPQHLTALGWHPAQRMSLIHHRDIATAVDLALTGALDRRIVNIADEAPTTVYELAAMVGARLKPVAAPLPNPWSLVVDAARARDLGFAPKVRTVHQAVAEGLL